MTYTKNTWVDQNVTRPRTYTVTTNQDSTITLTDSFGVVTELGTPVNATNMNHIEQGIYDNDTNITSLFQLVSWTDAGDENIELNTSTAVGTYNISMATILPSDNNDYLCLLSYTIERRDNNNNDTSYTINVGDKTYLTTFVEGDASAGTNYHRVCGQCVVVIGSNRTLKVLIGNQKLNTHSLNLLAYKQINVNP